MKNKDGFTCLVKAFRKNQSSAKHSQSPSRFLLTGHRFACPSAFTLAEVLITLSILGVVAAISIPNIIQNYQKQATVSRLKIAYSIIDRLTQQSYIENGYPIAAKSSGAVNFDSDTFYPYFGKYLNISKDCGNINKGKATGCFKSASYKNNNSDTEYQKDDKGNEKKKDAVYTLDGYQQFSGGYTLDYWYKVTLKNGMSLAVWYFPNLGAGYIFLVDIDGPNRGPSKLGYDVFQFYYYSPQIRQDTNCRNIMAFPGMTNPKDADVGCNIPRNTLKNYCKESGSLMGQSWNGMGCSGLIIKDGWKISSDYPWSYARKN